MDCIINKINKSKDIIKYIAYFDDSIIQPIEPTRQEVLENAIRYCLRVGMDIPHQWVDEYNNLLRISDKKSYK